MPGTDLGNFQSILVELHRHEVDLIVVGGVAALLEGAPVNAAFDLDVVHSREPDKIKRLITVLESLQATYRTEPEQKLKPDALHLASAAHHLLITRFGPLDVLGSIGRSHDYDDLLPHTVELEVGDNVRVRVLNLETLIAVKEEVRGEKDIATLPILRRTLAEKRRL